MRVSRKIISGTGILVILALLALSPLIFIGRIQSLNNNLVKGFSSSKIAEAIVKDVDSIENASRKFFNVEIDLTSNVQTAHARFEDNVKLLKDSLGSDPSSVKLQVLEKTWEEYKAQWSIISELWKTAGATGQPIDTVQMNDFEALAIDSVTPLLSQAHELSGVIEDSFNADAQESIVMGRFVSTASIVVPVIALALVIVSVLLLRTINKSLHELGKGTRMIAQGQFWHRLSTSGGDEFSELAKDFNSMSQRLGELDSMKKDFVSHVSHELKAPLASIRQTFHLLLEQIPGPINDQQKRLLRLSYNSAERLAAMVGNLLDVSRMEAGSMEYSVVATDLLPLVRSVAEEFEVQSHEKGVSLRIETHADTTFMVECDRDRLIQVIGNLFDNALKFSPRGSDIIVSLQMRDAGKERFLVFSVKDSGIGVPDEHKTGIFQKFHQVKQGKKMSGQGVGLGLAICGSIVEAHRGRIWVEDNPDGGSVFYFEIPAMVRVEAATA
jgi:signal transduction histidine kinase